MSPYSNERAQWIEGRLFCLANMARDNLADGAKRANQFMTGDPHEAHMLSREALKAINTERLMLMAERSVIEQYNKENTQYGVRT